MASTARSATVEALAQGDVVDLATVAPSERALRATVDALVQSPWGHQSVGPLTVVREYAGWPRDEDWRLVTQRTSSLELAQPQANEQDRQANGHTLILADHARRSHLIYFADNQTVIDLIDDLDEAA